jgi:hypothetical protein
MTELKLLSERGPTETEDNDTEHRSGCLTSPLRSTAGTHVTAKFSLVCIQSFRAFLQTRHYSFFKLIAGQWTSTWVSQKVM